MCKGNFKTTLLWADEMCLQQPTSPTPHHKGKLYPVLIPEMRGRTNAALSRLWLHQVNKMLQAVQWAGWGTNKMLTNKIWQWLLIGCIMHEANMQVMVCLGDKWKSKHSTMYAWNHLLQNVLCKRKPSSWNVKVLKTEKTFLLKCEGA